ncbi:hypothetical protein NQ317_011783 [Molorchus minor]|uniref:Uncharacterized protein n=1 Tax=Molorchus minor TaxID=1323400 RepID=A0ABQ9JHD2_9CUCU|nr:hypothetical protein NQ317_011783 [Molorchus minor]
MSNAYWICSCVQVSLRVTARDAANIRIIRPDSDIRPNTPDSKLSGRISVWQANTLHYNLQQNTSIANCMVSDHR